MGRINLKKFSATSSFVSGRLLDDIDPVDDCVVNSAYNYFNAERMLTYNGVHVKTDRSFIMHKTSNPNEWHDYESVIRLCKKNGFHLRCYIKYCFTTYLAPKAKGKSLSDIVYLRNYPQVIGYAKNKTEIERLYAIYLSIARTVMVVKKLCKANNQTVKEVIKQIFKSGRLSEYISTGSISQYFILMIPNIRAILFKYSNEFSDDTIFINDLYSRSETIGKDAINSIKMFHPSMIGKSILTICTL